MIYNAYIGGGNFYDETRMHTSTPAYPYMSQPVTHLYIPYGKLFWNKRVKLNFNARKEWVEGQYVGTPFYTLLSISGRGYMRMYQQQNDWPVYTQENCATDPWQFAIKSFLVRLVLFKG